MKTILYVFDMGWEEEKALVDRLLSPGGPGAGRVETTLPPYRPFFSNSGGAVRSISSPFRQG